MTEQVLLQEIQKATTDAYVELIKIDLTTIGGSTFYLTPMSNSYSTLSFMGQTWTPFPIQITGIGYTYGEAPSRPIMIVSNADLILQAASASYGDIVGATVIRYRTFRKFLADGSNPNNNAYLPPDTFIIDQKTNHDNVSISWNLVSKLDIQDDKLPARQMLRQTIGSNPGFPGLSSSTRFRS